MQKMKNEVNIQGRVYDHKLERKVSGPASKNPGTVFINGELNVATDDECLNVVNIHFSYVTEMTKKNTANTTYAVLNRIIEGAPTVMSNGKDNATKVRISTSVGLREFFRDLKDDQPFTQPRNEGGFVHIVDALDEEPYQRNQFKTDMVITHVRDVEADEDRGTPAEVAVCGYIFDFRSAILPVEFSVQSENGMKYFQKMDCSPNSPVFTTVWGHEISQTVEKTITEESAFGESSVRIQKTSVRKFLITGCSSIPYLWDDESTITAAEMAEAKQNREVYEATLRENQKQYQENRNKSNKPATNSATVSPSTASTGYHF